MPKTKQAGKSDLVLLIEQFESLKAELQQNEDAEKEAIDNLNAARINYDMAVKWNEGKLNTLRRQRNVIRTQFNNASEMIMQFTVAPQPGNCCASLVPGPDSRY